MQIVVVGAGVVGEAICKELSEEGHDIVLIEQKEEVLNRLVENHDITGLVGNGASYENLLEANTDHADIFIAVTEADEINIISCIIARKLGVKYTMARVRNPEYSTDMKFVRDELGISRMLNPEQEAARSIVNKLKFPNALGVEEFFMGKANIITLGINEGSKLLGVKIKDIEFKQEERVLICIIQRGSKIFIPNGEIKLELGDSISVIGTIEAVSKFYNRLGYRNRYINSSMIIGGGMLSHYLVEKLIKNNVQVKVVEESEKRTVKLSEKYPKAEVILGKETDQEFLLSEGIKNYDSVVTLTDKDEENIIISMFADTVTDAKVITKMNNTLLLPILENQNLTSTVVPKKIITDIIVRVVRSKSNTRGSKMNTLYRMCDNKVEVIIFEINGNSKALNIPLRDLNIKSNYLIACISRGNEIIYPGGNDVILENDRVMVVTTKKATEVFDDII